MFRAPSVSLQTLGRLLFPHVRHPTSAWSSPAIEFSLLVLQLFFSLPSVAGEEAVPHPSVTKHYFLGRIHHSWQWKVGVQTQSLYVIITAIKLFFFFGWCFFGIIVFSVVCNCIECACSDLDGTVAFVDALHLWDYNLTACCLPPVRAPHLGRELVCKESKKNFKATIAMSQDFPLGIESWVAHHVFPSHPTL